MKKYTIYLLCILVLALFGIILIILADGLPKTFTPPDSKTLFIGIGTSILASVTVAILDLIRHHFDDNYISLFKNLVKEAGLVFVYKKRDLDKYDHLVNGASHEICITGYSLNAFYESYFSILLEKFKSKPNFKLRVIFVDPDTEFSIDRARQEQKPDHSFKDSIKRFTDCFISYKNVEVRKIPNPLSTMIFKIDNTMFIGPHFFNTPSKGTVTFELSNKGWLFEKFNNEFETMWTKSAVLLPHE